jgi:hypothetical protein
MIVNIAVEGQSDTALARRVVSAAGHQPGSVRAANGTGNLDRKIPKYRRAAAHEPWVVLRDSDGQCPVTLRRRLEGPKEPRDSLFRLRIVHTMSEAWLLADPEKFADHFRVSLGRIPRDVESLANAKRTLLELCAQSRSRTVRDDVVTSTLRPGPLYTARINDFASGPWRVDIASRNCASLHRAITAIADLSQRPS